MQLFGGLGRGGNETSDRACLEPLGVIDIGSNSVRLVVYDGAVRSPTPLFNEKVLCGLGRSVATTGKLGDESVGRALAALVRFRSIAKVLGVKNMRAIATAAVRDAADGPRFIAQGEAACGVKIEILTGAQEARYAAEGIIMGFVAANGTAGDLGGGSLELIDVSGDQLNTATTLPLGGLRLIDTTGDKLERALPLIDEAIGRVAWLAGGRGRPFYAVGGTWRALAKLHMEHIGYPLRVMHGYTIPAREAQAFCEFIRRTKKLSALPGIEEIARARREVVPYGALVLERLLRQLEPSEVIFSVFGIREGLLYALLPAHERAKDPLICFAEDYARARSRSIDHARELCRWTDPLFGEESLLETPDETRLRHAACLMSDIGWRAHPDYRGEQSLNVLAHATLGGIDHEGRIFLALSVYFRHVGLGESGGADLSERLKAFVNRRVQKRARIVGAAIRTAHMLSIGVAGVIDETPLTLEPGKLVLTLPKSYAGLDGERLRRRLQQLAELMERACVIRVGA
jgi:exopolyphosphatase / guanosine-5'-triphosphate,3'-diphosphate pyrophosphatase